MYILALPGSSASAASLGPISSSWKFLHALGTSDWTPEMALLAYPPIRDPVLRIQGRRPDMPEAADAGLSIAPDIISDTGPDTLEWPLPPAISDRLVSPTTTPLWWAALYLPVIAEAISLRSSCSMARRIISGRPMPPPKARRAPRRRRPPPPAPGRPRASTTRGRAKESLAAASSAALARTGGKTALPSGTRRDVVAAEMVVLARRGPPPTADGA
mmetsp:Transcript_2659/g.7807  ORF Transcript_2659/g.7807 Transcript_2659/m.7807 type:complete len:216 (+) Transcript_2659:1695-2342(+)